MAQDRVCKRLILLFVQENLIFPRIESSQKIHDHGIGLWSVPQLLATMVKVFGADKKIGRTIGWYNKQGNLQQEIQYNEVAPLLAQLPPGKAGVILAQLEGKEAEISNPTAWIAKAARKAGASSFGGGFGGGGFMDMSAFMQPMQPDKQIGKTIGRYNKQGNLQQEIQYSEVAPLLAQLPPGKAQQILSQLEGKEAEITNPTAWIAKAARKAGAGQMDSFPGFAGFAGFPGFGGDCDPKIRKAIGSLNKQENLQSPIKYDQVKTLLSQLSVQKALHIVNGLKGKESEIKDPTGWISKAARKAGAA